ncbi:hypothetical protein JOC70_003810 [Clostridium pascui]|uniref:hypothetical protein n=1 Tax=Clostridium pascui TaxID=46609 RepID=UPI0019594076|nr:hypothetical protein [Clostridium pascui]MBM7872255.1 hypothetical protein [Clostridium pascui]
MNKMSNEQIIEMCQRLKVADTQEEVIKILNEYNLWDNDKAWRYYGDIENNYSSIGNQQSEPDAAIIEKIVNSFDAILLNVCREHGINPETVNDPKFAAKLIIKYILKKQDGNFNSDYLQTLNREELEILSQKVAVVVTGLKSPNNPSITIADMGEGQTPDEVSNTILSLSKSNKIKICFVQGKFNMGGSGALKFCGKDGIQLVITRRNPSLLDDKSTERDKMWSLTVIRKVPPSGNMRSSVYKYLAPIGCDIRPNRGDILAFSADTFGIMPSNKEAYGREVEYGTLVKLYEYSIGGYKTSAIIDNGIGPRIRMLLPNMIVPIRICEFRKFNSTGSKNVYYSGISEYLRNRTEVLEENFPSHGEMIIQGEKIRYTIYAFLQDKMKKALRNIGVLYTLNGQTQGKIENRLFSRDKVKLDTIKDDILVIMDCSEVTNEGLEQIFMNSRDRFVESKLKKEIEKQLEDILANHTGLRELNKKRKNELVKEKLENNKPLVDALSKLVKSDPVLKSLFNAGTEIESESKEDNKGNDDFIGVENPTYFKLKGLEYGDIYKKRCPLNMGLRVSLETNARNDYFTRAEVQGESNLYIVENGKFVKYDNYSLNLFNGIATLNIKLPKNSKVNNCFRFVLNVTDDLREEAFKNELNIEVIKEKKRGPVIIPTSREKKSHVNKGLSLPNMIKVEKEEWYKHNFNEKSALRILGPDGDGYTFFINMDNKYLVNECKNFNYDPEIIKSQFAYGLTLLGIAVLSLKNNEESYNKFNEEIRGDFNNYVSLICESWAPFVIPMLRFLIKVEQVAA